MPTVTRANQLGADRKVVASLDDAAYDQSLDAQLCTDGYRIDESTLVMESRRSRDHFDIRQLGKANDDRFRDTVAEVFGIRIRTPVLERQNGEGVDLFGITPEPKQADGRRERHQSSDRNREPWYTTRRSRRCRNDGSRFSVPFQVLQVDEELLGRLVTRFWFLLEALADQLINVLKNMVAVLAIKMAIFLTGFPSS